MAHSQDNVTLDGLADKVVGLTRTITSFLSSNGFAEPSFASGGPAEYPAAPEMLGPRLMLVQALTDMLHLAVGPKDYIFMESLTMHHDQAVLDVLNQFDFWDAIPINGSASYDDIAKHTKLPESIVRRILRYAMTMRLFTETSPGSGQVVHTATTAFVARNPVHRSWMAHNLEEVSPSSTKLPKALAKYSLGKDTPAQELEETGFAVEFKEHASTNGNFWDFIERDEGDGLKKGFRGDRFAQAMQVVHGNTPVNFEQLVKTGFDWNSLGNGTVVDVGGSSGHEAIFLASTFPSLQLVVQDLPRNEKAFHENLPTELTSRVTFNAHDFFRPQEITADVYFFKGILHDWPDKYAAKIFQALVPSLRPGARIILCEGIAPSYDQGAEWDAMPLTVRRMLSAVDLQMLVMFNAKQRTLEDWKSLLSLTDERLELVNVFTLPASASWGLMEIVFRG